MVIICPDIWIVHTCSYHDGQINMCLKSYGKSPAASGSWAIDKLLGGALGYILIYIYIYNGKLRSYIYQQPQPHPQVVTTLDSQTCVSSPNLRNPPKSGPRRHPKNHKNQTSRGKTWNSDPGLPQKFSVALERFI